MPLMLLSKFSSVQGTLTFSLRPCSTSFNPPVTQFRSQSPSPRQARGLIRVDLPLITASTSFSRQDCAQAPQPTHTARLTAGYIFLPSGCRLRIISMSAAVREETGTMRWASSPARRFLRTSLRMKGTPTAATRTMVMTARMKR